jgi:hypothetical protein
MLRTAIARPAGHSITVAAAQIASAPHVTNAAAMLQSEQLKSQPRYFNLYRTATNEFY